MTKLTKDAAAALVGMQGQPFAMVPDKIAAELAAAGLAVPASVELNEADTAAGKGCQPMQCTLEGLSYGKTGDNASAPDAEQPTA